MYASVCKVKPIRKRKRDLMILNKRRPYLLKVSSCQPRFQLRDRHLTSHLVVSAMNNNEFARSIITNMKIKIKPRSTPLIDHFVRIRIATLMLNVD